MKYYKPKGANLCELCINVLKINVMKNKMIEIDYEELVEINGGFIIRAIPPIFNIYYLFL